MKTLSLLLNWSSFSMETQWTECNDCKGLYGDGGIMIREGKKLCYFCFDKYPKILPPLIECEYGCGSEKHFAMWILEGKNICYDCLELLLLKAACCHEKPNKADCDECIDLLDLK